MPTLLYENTSNPEYLEKGLKGIDSCAGNYMNIVGTIKSNQIKSNQIR